MHAQYIKLVHFKYEFCQLWWHKKYSMWINYLQVICNWYILEDMKKQSIIVLVILALLIFGVIIFKQESKKNESVAGQMTITTSFYPLYYFTSQITGEKATIINITPAGSEPHDYEPTPSDIIAINESSILVLGGNGLETWGDKITETLKDSKIKVLIAGSGLATQTIEEGGEKVIDPHIWLDPVLAQEIAGKIADSIIQIDPEHTEYYLNKKNDLVKKLTALDTAYKNGLASCNTKSIVTSHAAFGYMANRYGLTQVAITGISPDEEPSPKELTAVAMFAKKSNVKYIFFESLVSPKLSETVAREIGAQTLVLNPIEGLSNDEINLGKDYISEMYSNLTNLRLALQCK
jgi:zinc transport system substrate-binding protein